MGFDLEREREREALDVEALSANDARDVPTRLRLVFTDAIVVVAASRDRWLEQCNA